MTAPPQLGPQPQRLLVGAAHARALVSSQFPQWAHLPVEPVANGGWDNCTFHLGPDMLLRLPTAAEYAQAVEKEHRWLPVLAPQLPRPIPVPLAKGGATADFPYPWSVYRWIDGSPASADAIGISFATELAEFLIALQAIDPTDGPQPGIHNWFRGGTLRTFDGLTQRALAGLRGVVDVESARRLWAEALNTAWDGNDRWFHGDVAAGNLLIDDTGQLTAVIDFGTCGVGDPACDLAVAWTLLNDEGRAAFRDRLRVDDDTWTRGRGWALWKTLTTCMSSFRDSASDDFAQAQRTLNVILGQASVG